MSGSDAKKPSIFDKLTDTKHYTGTHQHRFDAAGRGRGLAGRDRVVKGVGTSDSPCLCRPPVTSATLLFGLTRDPQMTMAISSGI